MSNRLDSDQVGHSVGPDLGPNCLQKLSADDTRMQRVNRLDCYIECYCEIIIFGGIFIIIISSLVYSQYALRQLPI